MLSINIFCIGKIKETYLKDAILEYSKRLSNYCKLSITEINDQPIPNSLSTKIIENIKKVEGTKIINHLKTRLYYIFRFNR